MSFSETEIAILKTIRNLTENFYVECSGSINLREQSYQIHHFGTRNSVPCPDAQYSFHTHPYPLTDAKKGWRFGGPPSNEDYEISTYAQQIEYVITRGFVYRFDAADHAWDIEEILEKLQNEGGFYNYLGHALEDGEISPEKFSAFVEIKFGLKVQVLYLGNLRDFRVD